MPCLSIHPTFFLPAKMLPMNTRNPLLMLLLAAALLASCARSTADSDPPPAAAKPQTHYRIVAVPDLSNRLDAKLYPRQLTDMAVFEALADIFPTLPRRYNRLVLQRDGLSVRLLNQMDYPRYSEISEKLMETFDLSLFGKEQAKRIEYLRGKEVVLEGSDAPRTLQGDREAFLGAMRQLYDEAGNRGYGGDIRNFFQNGLAPHLFDAPAPANMPGKMPEAEWRKVLVLVTDGYLEVGREAEQPCASQPCRHLGPVQLDAVRKRMRRTGESAEEAFRNGGFGIAPVENPFLAEVEVLVLEMYDRSLSKVGSATKHPTDGELLRLFWADFLRKSGAKRFQLEPAAATAADVRGAIDRFLRETPAE
jgi:hypothetical protein